MSSCNVSETTNDSEHQGVARTTDKEDGNDSQQPSPIAPQPVHGQDEEKNDVEQVENQQVSQMEEKRKKEETAMPSSRDLQQQRENLKRQRRQVVPTPTHLPATVSAHMNLTTTAPHSSIGLSQTDPNSASEGMPTTISVCSVSTPSSEEEAYQQKATEMEKAYLQQKYTELQDAYNQRRNELDTEYQQKCIELSKACQQNEERIKITEEKYEKLKQEYKEFQARMGSSISTDILQHSELSENLNDPCRQSELASKYDELKLMCLPKIITSPLFESNIARARIASLVKNTYEKAQEDMKTKTDDIERIFLDEEGGSNKHMMTYRDIKVKMVNLLALALLRRENSDYMSKIKFLISEQPAMLTPFIARWYKISCLMCLHTPQLVPSWDTRSTAADPDMKIFPPIEELDNDMDCR
ncbi:homer protein homolog 1-like [Sardina pilchardus]|uniref:homer protein homolog 1-like n=1 Tax=Sardina pilchardus TaxID=27697 RepID=UPI002E146A23